MGLRCDGSPSVTTTTTTTVAPPEEGEQLGEEAGWEQGETGTDFGGEDTGQQDGETGEPDSNVTPSTTIPGEPQ